jgi:chromosomal replication initiator protein
MFLTRELTDETLPAIGRGFHRNHTTVVHALKRVSDDIAGGGPAAGTVDMLRERLASRSE